MDLLGGLLGGGEESQGEEQQSQLGSDELNMGSGDSSSTDSDEETEAEKEEREFRERYAERISDDRDGFTLHQGEIIETHTYDTIFSTSWNSDYEGMSSDGSISIPFHKEDLKYIYKGVRCLLKTQRFPYDYNDDVIEIDDSEGYLCFITDVTISDNKLELSLCGFEKLLEEEEVLSFRGQRRSVILAEIIKMAGLVPVIDTTGLADNIIDWSTTKESSKDKEGDSGSFSLSSDGSMTEEQVW